MFIEIKSAETHPVRKAARAARRLNTGEKLVAALRELAQYQARIERHTERAWASITFTGARHVIELVFEGAEAVEAGECFIAFLPEHEFAIPGQLVADAAVTAVDHRLEPPRMAVTCDLLLLEDS